MGVGEAEQGHSSQGGVCVCVFDHTVGKGEPWVHGGEEVRGDRIGRRFSSFGEGFTPDLIVNRGVQEIL